MGYYMYMYLFSSFFSSAPWHRSDTFFRSCLTAYDHLPEVIDSECDNFEEIDSDGFEANEFYVILDRVYKYDHSENLDTFVLNKVYLRNQAQYSSLKDQCKSEGHHEGFSFLSSSSFVCYIQIYDNEMPVVKLCVSVREDFSINIMVHGKQVPSSHQLWTKIPQKCFSVDDIKRVLHIVSLYKVCAANSDPSLQDVIPDLPIGSFVDVSGESAYAGYKDLYGESSVRSRQCNLLVTNHDRCKFCSTYRKTLKKTLARKAGNTVETPKKNWLKANVPNTKLTENQKLHKLKQLKNYASSLESEVEKLKRQLSHAIKQGVTLRPDESADLASIMSETDKEVKESFSDPNCFQRLLWEQQQKYNSLKDKRGMRWHPMIIKWCIYLKGRSSGTYDALCNSGFISLPSERTLYDYTNITTKGTGYKVDVTDMLYKELYERKQPLQKHEKIVGLLQDEIRIKSDLVYDKHTGELIGFVDLDKVGNDLMNIQEVLKDEEKVLAKYVLVVMVRGVASNLKFPLGHFATAGITADQLFPILWKAVEICEIDLDLTVLYITSDGASPNRRFIKLHKNGDDSVVYRAENIFASDERYIYFFSDAPHLLKTVRNCFSNSNSHKKTRKMWKSGLDISWMHIVNLYKDYCMGTWGVCPKLTRAHIDISSFGCMKVNLAAQVMSATVANALEMYYPPQVVAETVIFIRHINKFFDCLNTRSLSEGIRKRNPNLKPFTSVEDERLDYLTGEFLQYFIDWKRSVENRPGQISKLQKAAMQLSYQTLEGLEITSKSACDCIKYCLNNGVSFVLTEKFNQDPIEMHFGNHRLQGGCSTNPNLDQFNSSMVRLRTSGSHAIAPLRGNVKRQLDARTIDATPIPKRPRLATL